MKIGPDTVASSQRASGSGHALTVTTKSPLILRDLDLLKTLAKRGQVRVHVSLISLDRLVLGRLEPGAPSPEVRLRTLAQLSQHRVPLRALFYPNVGADDLLRHVHKGTPFGRVGWTRW